MRCRCSGRPAFPRLDLSSECIDAGCTPSVKWCTAKSTGRPEVNPHPVPFALPVQKYRPLRDELLAGVPVERLSTPLPEGIRDPLFNAPVLMHRIRGYLRMAGEFFRAITSGRVDRKTYAIRRQECFGKPGVQDPCPKLRVLPAGKFCGGCGCGTHSLARLDGWFFPKLRWRRLKCPRNRPGFWTKE